MKKGNSKDGFRKAKPVFLPYTLYLPEKIFANKKVG